MHLSLVRRRTLGALTLATLTSALAPVARAQAVGPRLGRITVAAGGLGTLYHLPLVLADRLGFFRAEGLEVVLRDYPGGSLALAAVQAGGADVCAGAFEHVLRQQSLGQTYRSVVLQGRAPPLALGVSSRWMPGFRELVDLAGRRIGVSARGASTEFVASVMLARVGLSPSEVQFVPVGSGVGAMTALRSGQVHALCHVDPIITLLEHRAELRVVRDVRALKATQDLFGGAMPASCLFAHQSFVQKRAEQVQALANGMVHALKWLQTAAPADLVKAVPAAHLMGDRGLYLAAFNRVRETYSPHGVMPDDGPSTAWRAMARVQPEIERMRLDLGKTFSNDWARKARQKFDV